MFQLLTTFRSSNHQICLSLTKFFKIFWKIWKYSWPPYPPFCPTVQISTVVAPEFCKSCFHKVSPMSAMWQFPRLISNRNQSMFKIFKNERPTWDFFKLVDFSVSLSYLDPKIDIFSYFWLIFENSERRFVISEEFWSRMYKLDFFSAQKLKIGEFRFFEYFL